MFANISRFLLRSFAKKWRIQDPTLPLDNGIYPQYLKLGGFGASFNCLAGINWETGELSWPWSNMKYHGTLSTAWDPTMNSGAGQSSKWLNIKWERNVFKLFRWQSYADLKGSVIKHCSAIVEEGWPF